MKVFTQTVSKVFLFVAALLSLSLLSACQSGSFGGGSRDATEADAHAYLAALQDELRTYSTMSYYESGSGMAGNIKTAETYFTAQSSEFKPNQLSDHADAAMARWGEFDHFSTTGHGGGGNVYELHFGTHDSHVFIDLIAYEKGEATIIKCLVRVIE